MRITTRSLPSWAGLAVAAVAALPAAAQHAHAGHEAHASPYVDLTDRTIKALSQDEVDGLRAGRGLGFALSAELNGIPGPLHALELAEAMELDGEQVAAIEAIQDRMRTAAVELGTRVVELEAELDRRFAHRHVDADAVADLTGRIAELRGRLRAVHLVAHLETAEVLTDEQVRAYGRLRGYGG